MAETSASHFNVFNLNKISVAFLGQQGPLVPSGRLFTMADFVKPDPMDQGSQKAKSQRRAQSSDSSDETSESAEEDDDTSDNDENKTRKKVVQLQGDSSSKRNSLAQSAIERRQTLDPDTLAQIKRYQQSRRRSFRHSRLSNIFPEWHPLGKLTPEKRERFFFIRRQVCFLPVNLLELRLKNSLVSEKTSQTKSAPASASTKREDQNNNNNNNKPTLTLIQRAMSISAQPQPPYLTPGGGLIGGPNYPGGGTYISTAPPSAVVAGDNGGLSPAATSFNKALDASRVMIEIGPGGVPPTNLKTIRRRALAQLQACETQITAFKTLWMKNGGKEGGLPPDLDLYLAELDHVYNEALNSKQASEKLKKLGMQASNANVPGLMSQATAAPLHHQRLSVTKSHAQESLASQQSSKPSRIAGAGYQHPGLAAAPSKKFGAEVNEIRKIQSRQQLRQHLQNLLDSKTLQIRQFDSRMLIQKSLRIIERIDEWIQLYELMKPNLQAIASAVSRYCTSFIHEVDNVQVDVIWSYNNFANSNQRFIDSSLNRIEQARQNLDKKEKTIAALLICENDGETTKNMYDEGTEQMEAIVRRLKEWVIEDERYETKLRNTLRSYLERQKELGDSLKSDQRKKDELTRMALRREFKATLIDNDGQSHATEGKRLQRLLENLEDNEKRLAGKFQASLKELHESELEYSQPDYHLIGNIETLKRQLSANRKRIRAVKLRMQLVESEVVSIAQAKEAHLDIGRREMTDARRFNRLASEIETDLRLLDSKIRAVVRIIDLKRNPDILKRIFYQQQQALENGHPVSIVSSFDPNAAFEPADTDQLMSAAINLISNEIGHHLPELYRRLPFSPPRSASRRKKDLLQLGCREVTTPPYANYPSVWSNDDDSKTAPNQPTYVVVSSGAAASSDETQAQLRKLAYQVLRKWRRLNKHVTVMQLAETLRSMNLSKLADQIETARVKTLGLPAIHNRARMLISSSSLF